MLEKLKALFRRKWIYRSAVTGRFVSEAYALENPDTTYRVRRYCDRARGGAGVRQPFRMGGVMTEFKVVAAAMLAVMLFFFAGLMMVGAI